MNRNTHYYNSNDSNKQRNKNVTIHKNAVGGANNGNKKVPLIRHDDQSLEGREMESQNTMIRHSLRESQDPGSPGVPYLNANDIGNLKKIGMKGDKGDHPKTSSMAASQDHKGSQLSR